jgi:hypothetical protein
MLYISVRNENKNISNRPGTGSAGYSGVYTNEKPEDEIRNPSCLCYCFTGWVRGDQDRWVTRIKTRINAGLARLRDFK